MTVKRINLSFDFLFSNSTHPICPLCECHSLGWLARLQVSLSPFLSFCISFLLLAFPSSASQGLFPLSQISFFFPQCEALHNPLIRSCYCSQIRQFQTTVFIPFFFPASDRIKTGSNWIEFCEFEKFWRKVENRKVSRTISKWRIKRALICYQ